ncbi:hypothetical protein L6R49_29305, partial [Myxococcota bacterium]|nr:hypothetical protein [Myxococcota bacterium]
GAMRKVLAGVLIGIMLVMMCGCLGLMFFGKVAEEAARQPRLQAVQVIVNHDCSSVFDVCVRVNCLIRNVGGSTGQSSVEYTYTGTSGRQWTQRRTVSLGAGQQTFLAADFDGATWDETGVGECKILP